MVGKGRQGVRKPATKMPHLRKKRSKATLHEKAPRKR